MEMSPDPVGLIDTLARLVAANTENPPGREIEAARYLADRLADFGLAVAMRDIADWRPNVVARLENWPRPVFAFDLHLDGVPAGSCGTSDPLPLRRDAGRLCGGGVR